MKRRDMVIEGAQQLADVEEAVGLALSKVARFGANLEQMRIDSKLSAVLGQDALSEVFKAATLIADARGAMVRVHGHLDDVKTKIGCADVRASGLPDKGGDDTGMGPPMPHQGSIRRVA